MKSEEYIDFQIIDWNTYHEIDRLDEEAFIIQLFGRTLDDNDVCLKVSGYTPFFYLEIPEKWSEKYVDRFVVGLKNKISWSSKNNANFDYDISSSLIKYRIVEKHNFYNFTNKKLFKFLMLVFKNFTGMREFSNLFNRPIDIFGLFEEKVQFRKFESNIEPHIRFMHIQNIFSCGWIRLDKTKIKLIKSYSECDLSYQIKWNDVKPSPILDQIAPLKIMGYDIECISCDHNFPQAERETDQIIQIGMTFYRYGSMQCYEEHMLTLKECAPIPGACVESFQTEKDLIRGYAIKIRKSRPDIIAGYNNFGFDDKYIFDRIMRIDREEALRQNIPIESLENKFIDEILQLMGKVNNSFIAENERIMECSEYKRWLNSPRTNSSSSYKGPSLTSYEEKNLSSSALGENILYFFHIPGIISIDMMKVIRREHSLNGYKLDNVSANFITENVIKISYEKGIDPVPLQIPLQIFTRSTKALEADSYIQLMIIDGYSSSPLSENAKYKVKKIETIGSSQCINICISSKEILELEKALANPLLKIVWGFAKDDMHHTLMNKYFRKGNPKRIKQIAKYCLKDCKLVNLLLAKLDIIVNSIAMANVCNVPMPYLFFRGQGVKIFSLVSKKCRERGYLIPVLKKNSDADIDDSYEGATVITPKPAVYESPIGVLDFGSLYPNAEREKNTSHESYLNDKKYDNLPGYIYHDIHIKRKDVKGRIIKDANGNPQIDHHRFAQEIISEEQINKELGPIFQKIISESENKILKINALENIIPETRPILIQNIQQRLQQKLNSMNTSSERKISLIKEKYQNKILSLESSPLTEKHKQILIIEEKSNRNKLIELEKKKKYNTVKGQTVAYGIIPEILTELLNKRKETKLRIETESDPFVLTILNALQLAFKVVANSVYGQTGAPTSPIFFLPIAASTTAIGRDRLFMAKNIVESNFAGSEVIYGDSVTGCTPLICLNNNDICIQTIEQLGRIWEPYDQFKAGESNRRNKEQSQTKYKIWTSSGWSQIRRVIRHKTIKKIYRIITHNGCIDVTEDHSLLDKNSNIIKPSDCEIGMELLGGFMPGNNIYNQISIEEAFKLGTLLFNEIPSEILNGTLDIKRSFLNGCGCGDNFPQEKIIIQGIYYLKKCLGLDVSLDENGKLIEESHSNTIIKKQFLRYSDEYVYDLETTDGTFHAGIGELIIKNTDSIFINFHIKNPDQTECTDQTALVQTFKLCKEAAVLINRQVPSPHCIVYEKTFHPFILVAKKKYVGLYFENDPTSFFVKSMGIVLKRRDNAQIVKIVVGGIIDHILKTRNIVSAIENTKVVLSKLMNGEYPMDKFIISKNLRSKYKKPLTIAHKVLADRMGVRDPGNKPQINDRIPYAFVVKPPPSNKKEKVLQGDIIEDPEFIVKNNLKIDYLYYLEHQIIKPALQILELMMPTKEVNKFFNSYINEEQNKRKGVKSLKLFMKKNIEEPEIIISKPKTEQFLKNGKIKRPDCQSMDKWLKK